MAEPSFDIPTADWPIEELADRHDRTAFSSGHESLDDFIRKFAGHNQKSGVSRTFVATYPDDAVVRGYYSLSAGSIAFGMLTEAQRRRLPRYPVPVAHLGRLAVDQSSRRRGLGELLLIDAMRRVQVARASIGVHAIEVIAIDELARRFYVKYGFTSLPDDPRRLYISMKHIEELGLL